MVHSTLVNGYSNEMGWGGLLSGAHSITLSNQMTFKNHGLLSLQAFTFAAACVCGGGDKFTSGKI